ncbi:MAG: MBL fold metallo-hydrolase [Acidimicrobiia bacterium]|nr:MAG: MBL fold metallo-hydrolase [Acidimicrobiia bacterium]
MDADGGLGSDVARVGAVRLTVLGSNASAPSRSNPGSGYLLDIDGFSVLLDAGPGVFMNLAEIMDPGLVDAVLISHTHVDHCADVLGLFTYMAYGPSGPTPIPVYGPAGLRDRLAAFAGAGPGHPFDDVLEFHAQTPGDRTEIGPADVSWGEAIHPVPALVSRIAVGSGSLVFSGDTGPGGDLLEMAGGATLLLCEATLQGIRDESTYDYHLTASDAGEIASWAGVDELALTHIPSNLDPQLSIEQAAGAFAGLVTYAAPGTTFEITTTR